ncbi:MAG: DUF748 domain-containing protein [Syntrophorhabdales bacterium]|jgi:hypothetical protein
MKRKFLRKKIILSVAIAAALVLATLVSLLYFSNRIIKAELEKALGKDSRIERLSLGWNRVEARGVDVSKGGQTFFRARRVEVRASFFTLFGRRYSISRLTVEHLSLILRLDEKGDVINPMSAGQVGPSQEELMGLKRAIDLGHLVISDGAVTISDERPGGPATAELTGIEAKIDNFALPVENSATRVSLRMAVKGKLMSAAVTAEGSFNPATRSGRLAIGLSNVEGLADAEGPRAKAESVRFTASSQGREGTGQNVLLSDVTLTKPFIRIRENRAGYLVSPLPPRPKKGAIEEKTAFSLTFNKVAASGGEALFLDAEVSRPPYATRFTDTSWTADRFFFPLVDAWTAWGLSTTIRGKDSVGRIGGAGRTNFHTLETTGRLTLRGLDIFLLKPYLKKEGQAEVVGGTLDMDMDLTIRGRTIHAPTHVVIRNLQLAPGRGAGGKLLGVPRSLVVKLLQTSNNSIPLDFVVEGNVDNPLFKLRESFVRGLTFAVSRKLGLGVVEAGEGVVTKGERALRGLGKDIRGIFK